jgi:hypothetical protein
VDFLTESSSLKVIKDESFDNDLNEIPSTQANDIDYTIIDSGIDPLHSTNHNSVGISSFEKTNIVNSIKQQQQRTNVPKNRKLTIFSFRSNVFFHIP